jgi:hypothetical protein
MEWWIIAGLVLAAAVAGVLGRIRKSRRAAAERDVKTIYPLW